jgi:LuxR family maltose regulon positive regulatory protein
MTGNLQEVKQYMLSAEKVLAGQRIDKNSRSCISELLVLQEILESNGEEIRLCFTKDPGLEDYITRNSILNSVLLLLRGSRAIYQGNIENARECFKDCLKIALKINNYYMAAIANHNLMISERIRGNLVNSEKQCLELLQFFNAGNADEMPVAGMVFGDLAEVCYEWNMLDKAEQYARKGVKLGNSGELGWVSAQSYMILARIYAVKGNREESNKLVEYADKLTENDRIFYIKEFIDNDKARIYMLLGDYNSAGRLLDRAEYDGVSNYSPRYVNHYISRTRYYLGIDQIEAAQSLLNKLYDRIYPHYTSKVLVEILILRSLLFHRLGNDKNAFSNMTEAVQRSIAENYLRSFMDMGQEIKDILTNIVYNSRETEYKKFAGTVLDNKKDIQEIACSFENEILSEREIEILKLIYKGRKNGDIANELYLSVNTIKTHLLNIYTKLDVHNRMEAVIRAQELKLLEGDGQS